MKNPIQQRLQAETYIKLAETFLGKKNFSRWALFYACLLFLVAGWLPDGIAELLLEKQCRSGSIKLCVSFAVILYIWFKLRKAIKHRGKIEVIQERPLPKKVLAVFLSPLIKKLKKEALQERLNNGNLTEKDIEETEWEMPLRAIRHHGQGLKKVYVLTSPLTHGLIDIFRSVVKQFYPSVEVEEVKPGGIEFQDIKVVFEAVEDIYNRAKEQGFKESDVIVDVTGGQVTNSIAGAIATLTLGRKFQYVSTKDKNVLAYDIGYFEESHYDNR